jgi:4-carboxymuconolactone decarboxylase
VAPRIEPVAEPDDEQRELLAKTYMGPDGRPLAIFTTLATQPRLLRRVNALGGYFMAHGLLPFRERELVILRTAALSRSRYELGQHRLIAERAGLTPEEIDAAADPTFDHPWPDGDRTLLEFTEELLTTDTVSDPTWERLGASYDDHQRLELLMLVGFYRMLAGVLNGIGVELDTSVTEALAR